MWRTKTSIDMHVHNNSKPTASHKNALQRLNHVGRNQNMGSPSCGDRAGQQSRLADLGGSEHSNSQPTPTRRIQCSIQSCNKWQPDTVHWILICGWYRSDSDGPNNNLNGNQNITANAGGPRPLEWRPKCNRGHSSPKNHFGTQLNLNGKVANGIMSPRGQWPSH